LTDLRLGRLKLDGEDKVTLQLVNRSVTVEAWQGKCSRRKCKIIEDLDRDA